MAYLFDNLHSLTCLGEPRRLAICATMLYNMITLFAQTFNGGRTPQIHHPKPRGGAEGVRCG